MESIGERLRKLGESKGISQAKVANLIGISRTAYNKYESDTIKPLRKLRELSLLFGVSVDYILEGKTGESDRVRLQIAKYQALSESGKDIVDITLNAVYEKELCDNSAQSDWKNNKE